jgi:hypothetical protein
MSVRSHIDLHHKYFKIANRKQVKHLQNVGVHFWILTPKFTALFGCTPKVHLTPKCGVTAIHFPVIDAAENPLLC